MDELGRLPSGRMPLFETVCLTLQGVTVSLLLALLHPWERARSFFSLLSVVFACFLLTVTVLHLVHLLRSRGPR